MIWKLILIKKLITAGVYILTRDTMLDRYKAGMVLSAVGDALGYKNGEWEFCNSGKTIHKKLDEFGGLHKITVSLPNWRISDDTVLHIATAEGLVSNKPVGKDLFVCIADKYIKTCNNDMGGRAPGATTINSVGALSREPGAYTIPFNHRGGGCGAAMRSMCIGLRYPRPEQLDDLIAVSVESGRMTHHHPTGFLGSLVSSLFTAYAVQGKPVNEWGNGLMKCLPKALNYIETEERHAADCKANWSYFEDSWKEYLKLRKIYDGKSEPQFPETFGIKERDAFYSSISWDGWGGASGHDAPMIAYDALLGARDDWCKFCSHAMFHCGDSDSTGVIGACWWGILYGYQDVPECNYKNVEYHDRIEKLAEQLYELSHPSD
ncbi:ADP-ribosylhydrolase ARH1-like [Saccoglossus kowalevskii]|uniref:ADP-ribosylhydrolase ARH1 n=1 Tax=Saccoglossus kowalevskii TaxID=10224 RepID=A0ABM0M3V3_SACKO|nr:PREDICTED: Protein ADP-ribosylarginine hydrolase-like [Saccoglossus kowalevskii]